MIDKPTLSPRGIWTISVTVHPQIYGEFDDQTRYFSFDLGRMENEKKGWVPTRKSICHTIFSIGEEIKSCSAQDPARRAWGLPIRPVALQRISLKSPTEFNGEMWDKVIVGLKKISLAHQECELPQTLKDTFDKAHPIILQSRYEHTAFNDIVAISDALLEASEIRQLIIQKPGANFQQGIGVTDINYGKRL